MGSIQSYLNSSQILAVAICTGAISYVVAQRLLTQPPSGTTHGRAETGSGSSTSNVKKGKKLRQGVQSDTGTSSSLEPPTNVTPIVVPFPAVIPGGFDSGVGDEEGTASKSTKPKKRKSTKKSGTPVAGGSNRPNDVQSDSSATAPETYSQSTPRPTKKKSPAPKGTSQSSSLDQDGPWTRVETRRRASPNPTTPVGTEDTHPQRGLNASTSDAGITTSVTGTSTPATEDESHSLAAPENRRTLAEKLVPKARKTGVEDLLEAPDVLSLARVMRIQPRPDEHPPAGFSWADYEDVDDSRMTADDADGEDEGGWVVQGGKTRSNVIRTSSTSGPSRPSETTETQTKKQRQNAAKREAQKAQKADAEAERLATLAKHKRDLERAKMAEQNRK